MPPVKSTTRKRDQGQCRKHHELMRTKPHFRLRAAVLGEVRAAIRPTTGVRIRLKTNVQANPILRRLPTSPISTGNKTVVRIPSTIESVVIIFISFSKPLCPLGTGKTDRRLPDKTTVRPSGEAAFAGPVVEAEFSGIVPQTACRRACRTAVEASVADNPIE